MYKKQLKKDFFITTNTEYFDYEIIFEMVLEEQKNCRFMRNAKKKAFENSLCFGVFYKDTQIGFMRAITDTVNFAYICDVNIKKEYRRKGIGTLAFYYIMKHSELKNVGKFRLDTKNAHSFYEKFGFYKLQDYGNYMEYMNQ